MAKRRGRAQAGERQGLPSKRDFLEDHGCLDAIKAWENFGGLTLDEAYAKYCESPVHYEEDFMWMGSAAFSFYFPVIDRFVRDACSRRRSRAQDRFGRIPDAIKLQFEFNGPDPTPECRPMIVELCDKVIDYLERDENSYSGPNEPDRVHAVWSEIRRLAAGQ